MEKVLRFGIVGAGFISTRFTSVLKGAIGVEPVAVAEMDSEKAKEFSQKFGIANVYSSAEELCENSDVDAVYIGLPNHLHLPIAMQCMKMGKAVICEKPMAMTVDDAEMFRQTAQENDVLLMEGLWTNCLPVFRKVKEWIDTGKVGKVRLIDSSFCGQGVYDPNSRLFNKKMGGGALYDVGVYSVRFAMGLLGVPQKVTGVATLSETGVDELSIVNMTYLDGAIATSSCGMLVNSVARASVYGTSGSIQIEKDFYTAKQCTLYDNDGNVVQTFTDEFEDGFIYEIEHFRDLYFAGKKQSDIIPLSDTVECAKIYDSLLAQWGCRDS